MSYSMERLVRLQVRDFRSIRGSIQLMFGRPFTLLYAPNGIGKTSVLSALDAALTGEVGRLRELDSDYRRFLVNIEASSAAVRLDLSDGSGREHQVILELEGTRPRGKPGLTAEDALAFRERCYLDQSSLSRLLDRYQAQPAEASTAMAAFADEVLGLERLEAIVTASIPVRDLRNFRKMVPAYGGLESVVATSLGDLNGAKAVIRQCGDDAARLHAEIHSLNERIGLGHVADEPEELAARLMGHLSQAVQMSSVAEGLRNRLDELLLQLPEDDSQTLTASWAIEGALAEAVAAEELWRAESWSDFAELVSPAEVRRLGFLGAVDAALKDVGAELSSVHADLDRFQSTHLSVRELNNDMYATRQQMEANSRIGSEGEVWTLRQALASALPLIQNNVCPVCERDYGEVHPGRSSLRDDIERRVEDLLGLVAQIEERQRILGELDAKLSRLGGARDAALAAVADLGREESLRQRDAELQRLLQSLGASRGLAIEGDRLLSRRTELEHLTEEARVQSAQTGRVRDLIEEAHRFLEIDREESFVSIVPEGRRCIARLDEYLRGLSATLQSRDEIAEILVRTSATAERERSARHSAEISRERLDRAKLDLALMDRRRKDLMALANSARSLREELLGRVVDRGLNDLWRDLFARLAPRERFLPRLRLERGGRDSGTSIVFDTVNEEGDPFGSPGEMLSAGNLNSAALSLFLGVNLAVEQPVPWLVLDDPVQSMDDLHVTHFAALLRTMGRSHGRQVVVAVHDEALFEYLCLELTPVEAGESLSTVRLSRGSDGLTRADAELKGWRPESAQIA